MQYSFAHGGGPGWLPCPFQNLSYDLNAAVMPAATPDERIRFDPYSPFAIPYSPITFSCRRSTWPVPCGCARWYGCADRAPAIPGDDAGRDSSQDPSNA